MEAETRCFHACLFKCKWAAAPSSLFQNRTVPYILCQKKHQFGFDNHVYLIEIINFKAISVYLNIWNTVFWVHASEARAQKDAVAWHVSTKVSSLSCLIVLKGIVHPKNVNSVINYKREFFLCNILESSTYLNNVCTQTTCPRKVLLTQSSIRCLRMWYSPKWHQGDAAEENCWIKLLF